MKYHNENFNGTLDFRSRFHRNWLVELHLHEYSEILYCKKGAGDVFVNGRTVRLEAGEFVWLPPNAVHQYSFTAAELICAVFSNDFIPILGTVSGPRRLMTEAIPAGELEGYMESLPLLERGDYLKISGILNLIAAKVMEHPCFEERGCSDGILYQKVVNYLAGHYMEDVKLSRIARQFGYNEKYLSHALHQLTGVHFTQLLAYYRIENVRRQILTQPERKITAIAMECGFSSMNTFHRAFLRHTGMTPLEYRRRFRQPEEAADML